MNKNFSKTRIYLACIAFSFAMGISVGTAQDVVSIADGGTINDVSCASSVIITDSNIDAGNYGPAEDYTITICVENVSTSNAEIIISPALNGDIWDVDANSTLFIYDGADTGAPLLGAFNSASDPAGVSVSGNTSCLTMQFVSGAGSSGAGFTANFTCIQPLQPFLFEVLAIPQLEFWEQVSDDAIKICFNDSIIIDITTQYPLSDAGGNGYTQSDATSFFRYLMGDGTIYQGFGLTSISHTYQIALGYQVTIIIQDVQGRVESEQFFALIAPRPIFSNLPNADTLCIGEQTIISGGVDGTGFIGVDPTTSAILGGGILGEQLYLPDGNDENYETSIAIDVFDDGQVIENVSDIISFCVNMEHSYLGDLEMMLTCPNGTSVNVFNSFLGDGLFPGGFGGGGTFLGDANDNFPDGVPGIGFDYCFSMNAAFGTMAQEFQAGNAVPVSTFSFGNAMAPGTYTPEDSFANFIGCPINGDWTLTIRDNLTIDDGFIFSWSIFFDPNINPTTIYYSPEIVEVLWADNDDIVVDNGNSIVVEPSQPGNNAFTFIAIDEFGCGHDTTIFVFVRPLVVAGPDAIACNLEHILTATNAPGGAAWAVIDKPTPTAQVDFNFLTSVVAEVNATEYGFYTFQVTENNCNYQDETVVDFRPIPIIAPPFVADTVLCVGASITFAAGQQEANSGNFIINWTRDGNTFNTTDYAVSVNQTGVYILELSDVCGSASDTSSVVAVEIEFADDIICGLETFMQATLMPEGTGTWTSTSANLSFSEPNGLNTLITSSQFGAFPILFTDSRCPDDGVAGEITFVDQPDLIINPQFPDFCVESDSLLLALNVSGNSTGQFFWSVNGETQTTFGPTLDFAPMEFEPLEAYEITVIGFDNFGVCNVATGGITFVGEWCTYHLPNVITPNGDGVNDLFIVEFAEYFPDASLRIFNRWGLEVFSQENYDQYQERNGGWNPGDLSEGVYFIELRLPSLNKVETGNLTILREAKAGR